MHIALVSRFYPVAFCRFFERALKRTEHKITTVGPYTRAKIPWAGGMELSLPPELYPPPDIELPESGYFYPISRVEDQLDQPADLWIQINSTFCLTGMPRKGINAMVLIDNPTVNYDLDEGFSNFCFNTQRAWCKTSQIWLPFAYDKEFHSALPPETDFEYDIAHIGVLGKARAVFGEMCRQRGMKISFQTGPAYDQVREIYQKSRLIFSWSTRGELVARVFEALSMGRPLITDHLSPENGLEELGIYPRVHFYAFSDLSDALRMAKWALDHYGEAGEVAKRGQEAVRGHSYDARVLQILSTVGGKAWI